MDAGWCYKVEFQNLFGHTWQRTYDRRLNSDLHVKIESGDTGTVLAQRYGSCP